MSPTGTPMQARALPHDADLTQYRQYEVLKPIPVQTGPIAPAFGKLGGGQQHVLPKAADELVKDGSLREIPNPTRPV